MAGQTESGTEGSSVLGGLGGGAASTAGSQGTLELFAACLAAGLLLTCHEALWRRWRTAAVVALRLLAFPLFGKHSACHFFSAAPAPFARDAVHVLMGERCIFATKPAAPASRVARAAGAHAAAHQSQTLASRRERFARSAGS